MQGHSGAATRSSGESTGARRLRLLINPPQLRLDDRTVIFKYTGDGGWYCASFGDGAEYMRAAKEDPVLRRRIEARAQHLRRDRETLGPDLARVMAAVELAKDYDPDQARDEQGRWTSEGAAAAAGVAGGTALMYGSAAYADGLQQIGAQVLAGAARVFPAAASAISEGAAAVALPAAAFFGTLFFPTPRNLVGSDGAISDAPGYSYHFDQEAGHLTIEHQLDDGTSETVFDGRATARTVYSVTKTVPRSVAFSAIASRSMPTPCAATRHGADQTHKRRLAPSYKRRQRLGPSQSCAPIRLKKISQDERPEV